METLFLSFAGDDERQYPVREDEIGFVYRPIWDCARHVVLTYLCQPAPNAALSEAAEGRSLCVASCNETDRCRLDIAVLRAVLAHVGELHRAGQRLLIACPIHFSSIAVSRSWSEYSKVLNAAPSEVLRDVGFLVMAIGEGMPPARLAQEIPKLSARSKQVFAALTHAEEQVGKFANTGVRAVGIELAGEAGPEREAIAQIARLTAAARSKRLEAFALGMRSTSLALNAAAAGVRYLEGKAVWPAVKEPRHAVVHGLEHLYQAPIAV